MNKNKNKKKSSQNSAGEETKKEQQAVKPGIKQRLGGDLLRYPLLTVLLAAVVSVAGTAAVFFGVIEPRLAELRESDAQAAAVNIVRVLDRSMVWSEHQMDVMAAAPGMSSLLAENNSAKLKAAAALWQQSLGKGIELNLIAADSLGENSGLSFVQQEIAAKLLEGEAVDSEVVKTSKGVSLIAVRGIGQSEVGKPAAVLMITYPFNSMVSGLRGSDLTGFVKVTQSIARGAPIVVASYGDARFETQAPVHRELNIAGLAVDYYPPAMDTLTQSMSLIVALLAVQVLLLCAVVIFPYLLMLKRINVNAILFEQLAEKLVRRGKLVRGQQYTMALFSAMAERLAKVKKSSGQTSGLDDVTATDGSYEKQAANGSSGGVPEPSILFQNNEILDVELSDEDESLLTAKVDTTAATELNAGMFRQYDIRGVVGTDLTPETVKAIGLAIGSEALAQKQASVAVARDGRLSGPELEEALVAGIAASGCDVIRIGAVPTPVLYYATHHLNTQSGVVLTGSHNPANYNGLKIVIAGTTLSGDDITALYTRIAQQELSQGEGSVTDQDVSGAYLDNIMQDVVIAKPMKVVVDCGNGITGKLAPQLLTGMGCEVIPLYTEIDGNFPNHHPDPSKLENLKDLIDTVAAEKADIGLAFDGDGDRLGVVTATGKVVYPDRLMMLFAMDVLQRQPGADIIFDVKCSRDLAKVISNNGGRPLMWKTGHSLVKAKLKETGAPLAGEMSGHIFFNDRWFGFDDGLYSAARLLEILSLGHDSSDEAFARFPESVSTPEINIPAADDKKFSIVEALQKHAKFENGNVIDIDGLRVDFPIGWGLVRASNTTPMLVTRFEADTEEDLQKIQQAFKTLLLAVDDSLDVPF